MVELWIASLFKLLLHLVQHGQCRCWCQCKLRPKQVHSSCTQVWLARDTQGKSPEQAGLHAGCSQRSEAGGRGPHHWQGRQPGQQPCRPGGGLHHSSCRSCAWRPWHGVLRLRTKRTCMPWLTQLALERTPVDLHWQVQDIVALVDVAFAGPRTVNAPTALSRC